MRRWLALCLCGALIFVGAFPAPAVETRAESGILDPYLFEYFEYEMIVLSMLSDPRDASIPNWREFYLEKVEKYELFLKKYPDSTLGAEVKLRIAELYKDVEKKEVYPFRVELYRCLTEYSDESGGTLEDRKECLGKFYEDVGRWRDPVYAEKAVAILLELVRNHGHHKRYNMEESRLGGFQWVDEEIGARALYLLSKGVDSKNKKNILLLILREYNPGPKLLSEINEDLKKLKGTKSK